MTQYDVIIVGGGPAGSACATILARNGIRVLLCEKERFPRDKICGECINPRSWPFLKMLGVDETIKRTPHTPIEKIEVHSAEGKQIMVHPDNRQYPFLAMARREFDSILLRQAITQGAEVLEKRKVLGINHDGRWKITIDRQIFSSDYLVGADGRNSIVARSLGHSRRRKPDQTSDRVGIQWHTGFQKSLGNTLAMVLFPGGYFGAVNVSSRVANIAMVTTRSLAQMAQVNFNLFLEKTLFANPSARALLTSVHPVSKAAAAFPIDRMVFRSKHPFAFLIGDARQTIEPFTGEGIFFALQDGVRLGIMLSNRILGTNTQVEYIHQLSWAELALSLFLRSPKLGKVVFQASMHTPALRKLLIRAILGTNPKS